MARSTLDMNLFPLLTLLTLSLLEPLAWTSQRRRANLSFSWYVFPSEIVGLIVEHALPASSRFAYAVWPIAYAKCKGSTAGKVHRLLALTRLMAHMNTGNLSKSLSPDLPSIALSKVLIGHNWYMDVLQLLSF